MTGRSPLAVSHHLRKQLPERMQPLALEQVQPIAGAAGVDYLLGRGEVDGRRLIVVDIEKLMSVRKAPVGVRQAA